MLILFFGYQYMLQYRCWLLISRIYHTYFKNIYNEKIELEGILQFCELRKLDNFDIKKINLEEIKTEYLYLVFLFKSTSKFWNVPFIILSINYIFQLFEGFLLFFMNVTYLNNEIFSLISAFAIWFWGIFWIILYVYQASKLNNYGKDFLKIVSLVSLKYNLNTPDSIDAHKANLLITFIETNPCIFSLLGIEITWNKTIALFLTSIFPIVTMCLTKFVKELNSSVKNV